MNIQKFPYIPDSIFSIEKSDRANIGIQIERDIWQDPKDRYIQLSINNWTYIECPSRFTLDDLSIGDVSLLPQEFLNKITDYIDNENNVTVLKLVDQNNNIFFIVGENIQIEPTIK
jgi:hypothetical protein